MSRIVLCSLLPLLLPACVIAPEDGAPLAPSALALGADPIAACAVPAPSTIAGHEGDFYRCADDHAERGAGCGVSGYLLGYGARYAERFYRDARPRMSARGQVWIDDVLICLQAELRASIDQDTSCDTIRELAFDSHPACYLDSGFCTLPVWDVITVVGTIDASDWFGTAAACQAARTAVGCGKQYASWIRFFLWWLV